jgi:hypothetical protein
MLGKSEGLKVICILRRINSFSLSPADQEIFSKPIKSELKEFRKTNNA